MIATNTPTPAIVAASTTGDVIRAMIDDPAIRNTVLGAFQTVEGKSFVSSKTAWAAVLAPIISGFGAHFGLGIDEATSAEIAAGITSLVMLGMRCVTKTAITGIVKG